MNPEINAHERFYTKPRESEYACASLTAGVHSDDTTRSNMGRDPHLFFRQRREVATWSCGPVSEKQKGAGGGGYLSMGVNGVNAFKLRQRLAATAIFAFLRWRHREAVVGTRLGLRLFRQLPRYFHKEILDV